MATVVGSPRPDPFGAALGGAIGQAAEMKYMQGQWNSFLDWYGQQNGQGAGGGPKGGTPNDTGGRDFTPGNTPNDLAGLTVNQESGMSMETPEALQQMGGPQPAPPGHPLSQAGQMPDLQSQQRINALTGQPQQQGQPQQGQGMNAMGMGLGASALGMMPGMQGNPMMQMMMMQKMMQQQRGQ